MYDPVFASATPPSSLIYLFQTHIAAVLCLEVETGALSAATRISETEQQFGKSVSNEATSSCIFFIIGQLSLLTSVHVGEQVMFTLQLWKFMPL